MGTKAWGLLAIVLADAAATLWAHRFDGELGDVFVLQDELTSTIVSTLAGRVEAARLAWVLHDSAAASDALATALLVSGPLLPEVDGAEGGFLPEAGALVRPWPTSP